MKKISNKTISNKTLLILLIVAITISIISALFSFNTLKIRTTGKAEGTLLLEISEITSIDLSTDNSINFGVCDISAISGDSCIADSFDTGSSCATDGACTGGTWPGSADNITIENDGNRVITSLTIYSSVDDITLIGGTNPTLKYKATMENNACAVALQGIYVNLTASTSPSIICGSFGFLNDADEIELWIEAKIPNDAASSTGTATLTITGTS